MKAMGSLQDDRDRVLNIYKQLEEKHLQVMLKNLKFLIFIEFVLASSMIFVLCPR